MLTPMARSSRRRASGLVLIGAVVVATQAVVAGLSPAASGAVRPHQRPSSAPAYCGTGGQKLWDNLAVCGWPGRENTGPVLSNCAGGKLVPRGDGTTPIVLDTPNQVISCADLRGPVVIKAANVTITNSTVETKRGTGANGSASILVDLNASATITHVTVDGGNSVHACIWHKGTRLTVTAVNCSGMNDGVFTWAATSHSPTAGDDFTITDSYFHGFTKETSNGHDDGYQTEGASYGLIEHNTWEMNRNANAAIAIWNSLKSSAAITVADNLIRGGGFAVYAEDYNPGTGAPGAPSAAGGFTVTGIWFVDNVFSTAVSDCVGNYGVWFDRPSWVPYKGGPTDGWHRSGNIVLETGENIDNHNPHVKGQLCL
jgi:hypothetical protein